MIILLHNKQTNANEKNSEDTNNTVTSSFKKENIVENGSILIIISKI